MKSTDEIKKAMLHCSPVSCRSNDCPYKDDTPKYEGDMPVCRMKLWHDMVCLIQQLEADNTELSENIKWMEAERDDFKRAIKQLEAERDAALKDILYAANVYLGECETCKNGDACAACKRQDACDECPNSKCMCSGCGAGRSNWQWRGVQKEE